jgi:DNA-binding transcriptional LysR family regulator
MFYIHTVRRRPARPRHGFESGKFMNLRSLDLNLLVVFDAVMEARSVTVAASRLNMAQPSMSHALRRLRDALKDELFIRTPDGMVPTPKAERLAGRVRASLSGLRDAIEEKTLFVPEHAERRFILAMNNRAVLTLAAPLAAIVAAQAPGILLDIRPSGTRNVLEELDRGHIDLAIGGLTSENERFNHLILLEDRYVAVIRKSHPLAQGHTLSLAHFSELPHLALSSTGDMDAFVDVEMSNNNLNRRVMLRAPLLAAAAILQQSDMVAVISAHAATAFARTHELKVMQLPFSSPALTTSMIWHRRFDIEPSHQWLRTILVTTVRQTADQLS